MSTPSAERYALPEHAESKPEKPAEIPQVTRQRSEPSLKISARDSWAQTYEGRLRLLWEAAYGRPPEIDETEWVLFRESMTRLGSAALVEDGQPQLEPIPGSIQDVILVVAGRVDGAAPAEIAELIRTSLAPTLRRLEAQSEGTPENRTDAVVRALNQLRGSPAAADAAVQLMRYLQTQPQEQRGIGYYDTIDDLGALLGAAGRSYRDAQAFVSHCAVAGLWALLEEPGMSLPPNAQVVASSSAYRLATALAQVLNDRREEPDEATRRVMRHLQTISAVTTPRLALPPEAAAALLAELGMRWSDPVEFLTVLEDMGSAGDAWRATKAGQAQLVAMSAIPRAALNRPAASRIFNAGVNLLYQSEVAARANEPLRRGQLLMNLIGIRLALLGATDLRDAMVQRAGLDCGVNFLGAFASYRTMVEAKSELSNAMEPLARDLVSLARAPDLVRAASRVDLGRLTSAARVLGYDAQQLVELEALGDHIEDAVAAMRLVAGGLEPAAHPLLDSARLIRRCFEEVLPLDEPEPLPDLIAQLLAARADPDAVLRDNYRDYVGRPGEPGLGPFVVAGEMTVERWGELHATMLRPLSSIVSVLAEFPG